MKTVDLAIRIRLARALDVTEAGCLLRSALDSSAWREHDETRALWFEEACLLLHRDPGSLRGIAEELFARMSGLPVECFREHLTGAFMVWEKVAPAYVARGFDWICEVGEPGDADAVAGLLCNWVKERPRAPGELLPLVGIARWLLEHGASTLRSGRFAFLLPLLIDVVRHHAAEYLELALRYVVRNQHGRCAWAPGRTDMMWAAVEKALGRGDAVGLLPDLLSVAGVSSALSTSEFFAPFESDDLPCVRAEMVRAIARGSLPRPQMQEGWRRVIAGMSPRGIEAPSIESLLTCADVLVELMGGPEPMLQEWTAFVGTELLRHTGLCGSCGILERAPRRLEHLGSWPPLQPGLRSALERALQDADNPELCQAREILAEHAAPAAVYAAVHALPRRDAHVSPIGTDINGPAGELRTILRACGPKAVHLGLPRDALDVTHVEVCELEDDYAVRIEGTTLRVSEKGVDAILRGSDPSTASMRLAAYVVHELVHASQRIDDKRIVLELKKAGETTLLHLELSADHVTARILAAAAPGWDLVSLKDLQGRSLADFPARDKHGGSAVERKSVRLVSLRADYLIRRHRPSALRAVRDYVYVDYPPGPGTLAVLASGSLQRVIATSTLDARGAQVLAGAARAPMNVDGVDEVLETALRALGSGATAPGSGR